MHGFICLWCWPVGKRNGLPIIGFVRGKSGARLQADPDQGGPLLLHDIRRVIEYIMQ